LKRGARRKRSATCSKCWRIADERGLIEGRAA
jgi:hypothetical protein